MDDRLKDALEGVVRQTVTQGYVDGVSEALIPSMIISVSRSREVFAELVEGASKDTVGRIEGLFNAVTMMNIDVDIKDTIVISGPRTLRRLITDYLEALTVGVPKYPGQYLDQ